MTSDPSLPAPAPTAPAPAPTAPAPDPRPGSRTTRSVNPRLTLLQLAAALVLVLGGGGLFLSGYLLGAHVATTPGTPAGAEAAFAPFWDAYTAIRRQYAGSPAPTEKQLVEGAIQGLFNAVGDPFSGYMDETSFAQSLEGSAGQFQGIGATMGTRTAAGVATSCSPLGTDCRLIVESLIEGAPAQKSGLQPGDRIVSIDGSTVDGLTLDQAVAKVRGNKGTTVTLGLVRAGETRQLSIVRDVIIEQEVISKSLANGTVAYLHLTGFSPNSPDQFEAAVKAALKAGARSFIVDLRGNGGGYVTAARGIASQFIGSGPIFWQVDARGTKTAVDAIPGGAATDPSIKVAVLIDKNSASASEILAGALQDTGRAKLVGQQSFGKGTVQEWYTLPGDTGGFRLTIARWLTPVTQRWINKVGLTPDIPVTVPASTPPGADPVLDAALEELAYPTSELAPAIRPI